MAATTPPAAAVDYFFPDLKTGSMVYDGTYVTIKPIIAIVTDYTWFEISGTLDHLIAALRAGHGVALPFAELRSPWRFGST